MLDILVQHYKKGLHVPQGSVTLPEGHFLFRYCTTTVTPLVIIILSSLVTIHFLWL